MTRLLLTSDWHLTDSPRDEYRWSIFPWLRERVERHSIDAVLVLGDVTDRKDHHSARLVNRLVDELRDLSALCPVHVIKGNHDYEDPSVPYLRFLGVASHLSFYARPADVRAGGRRVLLLPHSRRPLRDWPIDLFDPTPDLVCCHQTFRSARASNGHELEGLPPRFFELKRGYSGQVVSGDVHVPQRVGQVVYCGSPHPVRFGDSYEPRVVVWEDGRLLSLRRRTVRKVVLDLDDPDDLTEALEDGALRRGDHVRLRLRLLRRDFPEWAERAAQLRARAHEAGLVLAGVDLRERGTRRPRRAPRRPDRRDHAELLQQFCRRENLPAHVRAAGTQLSQDR